MEYVDRPKEFFIGRYIYLKERLDSLPTVTFTHRGNRMEVSYYETDKLTGEIRRRRFSTKNPDWERWSRIAEERITLKKQLDTLLQDWSKYHKESLKDIASQYRIIRQESNGLDMALWNSMSNNQCSKEIKHPFIYKGITMRSQFETVIASILDDMHLDYKYDVRLDLVKGTVFPDFAVGLPEYDRCGFLEYLGALKDFSYISDNAEKFENYVSSGLYINRDIVFIPGDKYYRPDYETIRELICVMLGALARKCVVRSAEV